MNRRGFLKSIGKAGIGLVLAPSVVMSEIKDDGLDCSCPAPYITDVSKKNVKHFDSCAKLGFDTRYNLFELAKKTNNRLESIVEVLPENNRIFAEGCPSNARR